MFARNVCINLKPISLTSFTETFEKTHSESAIDESRQYHPARSRCGGNCLLTMQSQRIEDIHVGKDL